MSGVFARSRWSAEDLVGLQRLVTAVNGSAAFDSLPGKDEFRAEFESATLDDLFVWRVVSPTGYLGRHIYRDDGFLELHFVEEGAIRIGTEDDEFVASAGTAILLPAPRIVNTRAEPGTRKTSVAISRSRCMSFMSLETDDPASTLRQFNKVESMTARDVGTIHQMASLLLGQEDNPFAGSRMGGSLFREAVLATFIQSWPRCVEHAAPTGDHPKNLRWALDWINDNLGEDFTVDDIAKAAGQSVRSLQTTFQEHIGMAPFAYVQRQRLQQVHHELRHGDPRRKVSEIAERWGFSHMGYFSSRYRALYGETPSRTLQKRGREGA